MKKFLILSVVLLGVALSQTMAQVANLTVNITATRSVIVNTPTVAWTFNTADQFTNGELKEMDNHIKVVSTTGYAIQVTATDLTGGTGGAIPASSIQIVASGGSTNAPTNAPDYVAQSDLNTSATNLLTTTTGTSLSQFKVDYFAKGGANFLGRSGAFAGQVTYSIIAN
jgi:hypothetical protein